MRPTLEKGSIVWETVCSEARDLTEKGLQELRDFYEELRDQRLSDLPKEVVTRSIDALSSLRSKGSTKAVA